MQIDRSRHLKSREISATSPTRDPKSKLYSRAALLSEESDLVFPFFSTLSCHDLRKLPLCPTTKGSNRCHVIIFYLRSLSLPASVAARKTTRWIKEESERIRRDRGKEFHVVVRVHSLWNFYLCRESHSRKLHSSSFTLCVCVRVPLNK